MNEPIGHVQAVSGTQATVALDAGEVGDDLMRIGAIVTLRGRHGDVVGAIGAVRVEPGTPPLRVLVVDLLGELDKSGGEARFHRGVNHYPSSGAPARAADEADLTAIYRRPASVNICVGALHHDPGRPAYLLVDDLLSKHFAVIGTTGTGKSCAVTLILSAILADHPGAHVVLLDPHNEYASAFGDMAELINVDNLQLPFWLFNFAEATAVVVRGGTAQEQEAQAIILHDAILRARRNFVSDEIDPATITVDTPVPFRVSDLLRLIEEAMGSLDRPDTAVPFLRLKARLESLRGDRRFAFMFSDWLVTRDTLAQVVGRLLRIPVEGKPITIMDLSGVPSEVADVVVSLSCRLAFDFALWSGREQMPPVLLVCEEAHRYVPADERLGFAATAEAIGRIAKEGRKYGVSLALISQRPSELSARAISQCGTVFALRLTADLDQHFVAAALPDAAHGMLAALPNLRTQEAIISGEGVSVPMRIRFDELAPDRRPRSQGAEFSAAWRQDVADGELLREGVRRWRQQSRRAPGD